MPHNISENKSFDPDGPGLSNAQIFGLPGSFADAAVVLIPVPWDLTASYGAGSSNGPDAIKNASYQVDLMDPDFPEAWKHGIYLLDSSREIWNRNRSLRPGVSEYLRLLESGADVSGMDIRAKVNAATEELRKWTFEKVKQLIGTGKTVGVVGGDHSTILGPLQAALQSWPELGVLQLDAHADLRVAYEGFTHSHASIAYNLLEAGLNSLTQVGIRDYSTSEAAMISSNAKITTFFQHEAEQRVFEGATWKEEVASIVQNLPAEVWISLDIDALDPALCPHTGTPVPGGLSYQKTSYLLSAVVKSGRKIVGFDLVEVAPGDLKGNTAASEWDAAVGARLLLRLSSLAIGSQLS